MSEDAEFMFTAGSIISLITCHEGVYEGEVLAFDYHKKILLIKCPASSGQPSLNDVHLINLSNVTDVKIKKEVKKEELNSTSLPHLNINKVELRKKQAIEERKRLAKAFDSGVTDEGIEVFLHLSKTIDAVTWEGKNIIVMKNVVIQPPYKPENCIPSNSSNMAGDKRNVNSAKVLEAVSYIKQLLEKYWNN